MVFAIQGRTDSQPLSIRRFPSNGTIYRNTLMPSGKCRSSPLHEAVGNDFKWDIVTGHDGMGTWLTGTRFMGHDWGQD